MTIDALDQQYRGLHGTETEPNPAELKMEVEELSVPQQTHEMVKTPFVDPLVENVITQINALQQCGEPDDTYHHCREAAVRLHHVTFERTQACLDPNRLVTLKRLIPLSQLFLKLRKLLGMVFKYHSMHVCP
jgi:hypothetical protein